MTRFFLAVIEFFVGMQPGRLILVAAVAGLAGHHFASRECADREARAVAEAQLRAAAEHMRREAAIDDAWTRAAADAIAAVNAESETRKRLKESEDASHANDRRPCLDRPGVMRLNRLTR